MPSGGVHPIRRQTVHKLGEGISQTQIADDIGTHAAAIVRSLDRLEEHGLIERRSNEADRRNKAVFLTDAGRETAARILGHFLAFRASIFDGISDEDGRAALRVLSATFAALRAYLDPQSREMG